MKKTIVLIIVSLLTVYMAATPLFAQENETSPGKAEKQNGTNEKKVISDTTKGDAATIKKSEYALPYPGILPDHPLYALKKLRDGILDKLIVDPIRKAEFYLLQADKHLNMSVFLLDKGKSSYAKGTIRSSVQFMEKSIKMLTQVKESKNEIPAHIVERVEKSIEKHIEVYGEITESAGDHKDDTIKALDTMTKLSEQIAALK